MQGHRTRVAQQAPERWNDGEDALLSEYLDASAAMDRRAAILSSWPRGWLVVGSVPVLLGVAYGGWPPDPNRGPRSASCCSRSARSPRSPTAPPRCPAPASPGAPLRPLLAASTRDEPAGSPEIATALGSRRAEARDTTSNAPPLLEVADVAYTYPGRPNPAVRRLFQTVRAGDRVLIDAPSGSGKSTLVSAPHRDSLAAVRQSAISRLRFRDSIGERGWTRHLASAPQFHENHLFADTLAFNLLLGRKWPPTPEDVEEAERLCHRLGLGELLATMPGGMNQMVGEAGWQLSHGERSRVFLARALLQGAEGRAARRELPGTRSGVPRTRCGLCLGVRRSAARGRAPVARPTAASQDEAQTSSERSPTDDDSSTTPSSTRRSSSSSTRCVKSAPRLARVSWIPTQVLRPLLFAR